MAANPPEEPWNDPASAEAHDHALIRRAQAGEEAAFAELVARHEGRAWRVARNLVGNREDAQDLAQEAFLRVFRSLERFDFQHEFSTWLYRIVTNLAIDHLRRRRVHVSTAPAADDEGTGLDLPDVEGAQPEDALRREETALEVRSCIEALAPHFRVVMALRELEGLPCADIARIVGATNVTVRWRLHRGRKLFQEEWERRERLLAAGGQGAEGGSGGPEGSEDRDEPLAPPTRGPAHP